jgi:hypothetical protein
MINGYACILGLALMILVVIDWSTTKSMVAQGLKQSALLEKLIKAVGFVPAMIIKAAIFAAFTAGTILFLGSWGAVVMLLAVAAEGYIVFKKTEVA